MTPSTFYLGLVLSLEICILKQVFRKFITFQNNRTENAFHKTTLLYITVYNFYIIISFLFASQNCAFFW